MRAISKSFGATRALLDVDLSVHCGEVHALVGENGAGKSTLVKILAGAEKRDAGTIHLAGKRFEPRHPAHTLAAGIVVIYQELNLAGHLNAAENIFLGQEETAAGFLLDRQAAESAHKLLHLLGVDFDVTRLVRELSVAQRQMVEIARALAGNAQVVVMDEPTATLAPDEAEHLFTVISHLKRRGVGVIYISHRMEEIFRVADRYTVLRDGVFVRTGPVSETTREDLIAAMVGRQLTELYPRTEHARGETVLDLRSLTRRGRLQDVSLTVRRGEIVGVAGLVGSGRTELLRAVFGLDPVDSGEVVVAGKRLSPLNPRTATRAGISLLSEDRAGEGLAFQLPISANVTLSRLDKILWRSLLNLALERREVTALAGELGTKMRSVDDGPLTLSGGNQQKIIVARALFAECDVVLFDEPTRGIDVGAKSDIFRLIGRMAAEGKGIVMVSSYLPELLGVADTIAVMCDGRLSEKMDPTELTQERLLSMMTDFASRGAA